MNTWLLSIVGVVAIGVLLEILLEEGQTAKYIKGIFSLAIVLVIVAPIPKLLNKNFDFDSMFGKEIVAQNSFIVSFNKKQNELREQRVLDKLKSEKMPVQKVRVFYLSNDYDTIDIIKIYCKNTNVDKNKIIEIVGEEFDCTNDKIKIYQANFD